MPPLLKTLSARSFTLVEKIALLSKSEQFFGLGARLFLFFNNINYFLGRFPLFNFPNVLGVVRINGTIDLEFPCGLETIL